MDFIEYLKSKKIDPVLYKAGDEVQFTKFQEEFAQMHPNSFTSQKLFLINNLRRKYLLEVSGDLIESDNKPKNIKRPMVKPKAPGAVKPVIKKQAKPVIKRPKTED
ncbi:MAG: hypothetical protein RLO81_01975 [Fulvivirga sp.]|uniref:hypothetical protein n=1 Tax=Fulvivirga sp. TaxID=1931237 RepID=UPI0032EB15FF